MMTISLTPEAQQLLDRYLSRARFSLRGTSVEADEIERDVRAHIEEALNDRSDPVPAPELDEVLGRLGSPDQWVPEDEVPLWRRVMNRFSSSSRDWRLSYICFGLMLVGFLTFPMGGFVLVFGAYLLARATLALMAERDEALGARRWLIYPPLVIFGLALVAFVLGAPVAGFAGVYFDSLGGNDGFAAYLTSMVGGDQLKVGVALTFGAAGAWFVIVAALSALLIKPLRALLVPIANRLQRRSMMWLGLFGILMIVVCGSILLLA